MKRNIAMRRSTSLALPLLALLLTALPAAADDPPLNTDFSKLTPEQKVEKLMDELKAARAKLDTVNQQILMLEDRVKELGGLGDKLSATEMKVNTKFLEVQVLLNKLLADQKIILDTLQKQQTALDDLRRGGPAAPPMTSVSGKLDPALEERLQRMERYLEQMGMVMAEVRKVTPVTLPAPPTQPLPTQTEKAMRRVRVVNKAPMAVTVYFNELPFKVEANSTGDYIADQDSVSYEVVGSNNPRKTVTVPEGKTMTLTLNWP
jgi:hypothetical protein